MFILLFLEIRVSFIRFASFHRRDNLGSANGNARFTSHGMMALALTRGKPLLYCVAASRGAELDSSSRGQPTLEGGCHFANNTSLVTDTLVIQPTSAGPLHFRGPSFGDSSAGETGLHCMVACRADTDSWAVGKMQEWDSQTASWPGIAVTLSCSREKKR